MKRGAEAFNRRDIDATLEEVDSEIEWAAALPVILGGETTVSRGHEAVREMFRDLFSVLDDIRVEYTDFRDLDDRLFCAGHIWTRGRESGADTESPYFAVVDMKNGKAVRISHLSRSR